jgi:hypothetical protein
MKRHLRNRFLMRFAMSNNPLRRSSLLGGCAAGLCLAASLALGACAQGQTDTASTAQGVTNTDVRLRPSGPSKRTEWRKSAQSAVERIDIDRALSGEPLVAGANLIRQPNGAWAITPQSGQTLALSVVLNVAQRVQLAPNHTWEVRVTAIHTPAPEQPGISQEDEPYLTLTMSLITP